MRKGYLSKHFDSEYYQKVKEGCELEKAEVKSNYDSKIAELKRSMNRSCRSFTDHQD